MRCYNCGKELLDDTKVCLSCGKKVGAGVSCVKETFSGTAPVRQKRIKPKLTGFRFPLVVVSMLALVYIIILYLLAR